MSHKQSAILEVYLCTLSKMPFGVLEDPKEEIF